ncbi:MAG: HepT-like ribonuclease domain-containing protein [Phycisphaeraceae bacterium]
MPNDVKTWLWDIHEALSLISNATAGMPLETYRRDRVIKAAVERQFTIIGEALNRIRRTEPQTFDQIDAAKQIVGFRNILVHGYDIIKDDIVWRMIQEDVPVLLTQSQKLLDSRK